MSGMDDTVLASGERILSYVERVERTNEEIDALNKDKRDIYAEAKSSGFDVTAIKELVKERKKDPSEVQEADAILETYRTAMKRAEQSRTGISGTRIATRVRAQELENA